MMSAASSKKALLVSLITVFIDMLGFGLLVPILPLVLIDPTNPLYVFASDVPEAQRYIVMGFVIALYPLTQLFSTPILGQLSDRFGRKPLLAFSLAGTLIAYALTAIGVTFRNLPLLILARALDGISGGNISVAQAIIADVSNKRDRARYFGYLGAAYGLGLIIGPFVSSRLTTGWGYNTFGVTGPYILASVLAFSNLVFLLTQLPETRKVGRHIKIKLIQSIVQIKNAITMKKTRIYFLLNFLLYASLSFITSFFSLFLITRFHVSPDRIGVFISLLGASLALSQIIFTEPFVRRVGSEAQALTLSLLGAAGGVLLMFLSKDVRMLYLTAPIMASFLGLSQAYLLSLVSKSVSEERQGEILGLTTSVTSLAQILPPILSGVMAALFTPGTPILLAACSLAFAGIIYYWYITHRSGTAQLS